MAYTPEQEAQARALLQKGDALGAAASKQTGVAYNPITTPISATGMQANPTPVNVPAYTPPPIPTIQDLQTEAATPSNDVKSAQDAQNQTLSRIEALIGKQGTEAQRQGELEMQAGIPDLQKNLNQITAQINGINASAFNATQDSENRLAPTFAIYGEQAQIQRQKSAQTFGLAAAASAMQNNIALAQSNVQRALDAEFGAIESQLKFQGMVLDMNRDNLSKAEAKQAQALDLKIRERERLIAEQKADRQFILNTMTQAAQNGADAMTIDKIRNATSSEEAASIASQSLGEGFRQQVAQQKFQNDLALRNMKINEAQLRLAYDKVNIEKAQMKYDLENGILSDSEIKSIDTSPQGKKLGTLGDLKLKLVAYQDLVKKYGTSSYGSQKSRLDASFADLKIAYKTAAELGALQGPDVLLLEEALRPATYSNPISQVFSKVGGNTTKSINANLEQAMKIIDASGETNLQLLLARNPKYSNSSYVETLALPFMQPSASTVNIGGQSVPSGTIIQNAQGQKARVNPDGTVTPL